MVSEKTLMKFGLIKDENNLKLREVFEDNVRIKEIHIDVYPENPLVPSSKSFMLMLRTIEENAIVENNEERLILKRNDRYSTYFMNVLFSDITECCYKTSDNYYEFILNIQNIYYRIIVLN